MSLQGSKPSYWDGFPKGANPVYPTPLTSLIQPPPAQPTPTTQTTKTQEQELQAGMGRGSLVTHWTPKTSICVHVRGRPSAVPEEWVHLDTSGIGEPGSCSPRGLSAVGRARGCLGRLRCLGEPEGAQCPGHRRWHGQQPPSQVPDGAGRGPTGFSQ